jgi:hypothetical protein
VVVLVLLEGSNQNAGCVQHYLVQGPTDACILLAQQQLLVEEVPSVMHACQGMQQVFQTFKSGAQIEYRDWRTLHEQYGSTQFLVSPLSYATQSLGALLLANNPQTVIDGDMRILAEELSASLSSTLHTLGYIRQLRAGEQIIQDVLPAQVADHLKRRMLGSRPTVALGLYPQSGGASLLASPVPALRASLVSPAGWSQPNQALQLDGDQQQELRRAVQQLPQQQGLDGPLDSALAQELTGQGIQQCVPVVYQQWHPQVSTATLTRQQRHMLSWVSDLPLQCIEAPTHNRAAGMPASHHVQMFTSMHGEHSVSSPEPKITATGIALLFSACQSPMASCMHLQVTVMFADIAGYTALSTQVEPEEVRNGFGAS